MKKQELDQMTMKELKEKEQQLSHEVEQLEKVIEASNTTVFDILIGEVKKEMENNIAEEEWKILKENQKKIESYRSIEKTLQNQEELLERKKDDLDDVKSAIENYQTTIYDQMTDPDNEVIITGYTDRNSQDIRTGDVYKSNQPNVTNGYWYYLIKKSAEIENSYAIISNYFKGEKLLQYEKNRELLDFTHYEGNIFINDDAQEKALEGLRKITETQDANEEDEEG